MRKPVLILFIILFLVMSGCDEVFSPKGEYVEKLVLYSILSNKNDTQYVRLYTTYNPTGFDPLTQTEDTPVRDATVSLIQGRTTSSLNDTLITRWEKGRYQSEINAYVIHPYKIESGAKYKIEITSPSKGSISAETVVPSPGVLTVDNSYILNAPDKFTDDIIVRAKISPLAQGFYVRFFLVIAVQTNGVWVERYIEVPESLKEVVDCINVSGTYPRFSRKTQSSSEFIMFERRAFMAILAQQLNLNAGKPMKVVAAKFELIQSENHLYRYFNIVNGFQDPSTIRVDEPDYSNIKGAVGLFGGFWSQQISFELPDSLGSSFRCR